MDRGPAHRIVEFADAFAGADAETHRRIGRAERGGSDLGNRLAEHVRKHGHAVDVAEFALLGAEAQRGVSLEVFRAAIAFAHRKANVGDGRVVLKVDELLRAAVGVLGSGHAPQRLDRVFHDTADSRWLDGGRFQS